METYFHRIGRTGRFGKYGVSVILLTDKDEDFILHNKEYFVNIKELPDDLAGINNFLAKNKEEGQVKDPAEIPEEKKEYTYGNVSQISGWKSVEHDFYDSSKYKYYEVEGEEGGEEGEGIEEEEQEYVNQETLDQHMHEENYWGFLKCRVCYQFLAQSEKQLGRKFEILQYFQVEDTKDDETQIQMEVEKAQ